MLTFQRLALVNRERCESPNGFNHKIESWSLSDWFTALAGETGELGNVVKKLNRIRDGIPGNLEGEDMLLDQACDELADIIIYGDLFATRLGIKLENDVIRKFNKTSAKIGSDIRL